MNHLSLFATAIVVFSVLPDSYAQNTRSVQLKFVQSVKDPDLDAITSVVVSPDNRFVYVSAYKSGSHAVFARAADTGRLTIVQTFKEPHLDGATALRLSSDGRLAAAASFRGRAVSLYKRDAKTGMLTPEDHIEPGFPASVSLDFPVDLAFSPDSKFINVLDGSKVTVLKVSDVNGDLELNHVESFADEVLANGRGLCQHPSGKFVFVASHRKHSLVVLERDIQSGKLSLLQTIEDGSDGADGLESVFGVTMAGDQHLYSVSGQQGKGDDSVMAFDFAARKTKAIQCVVPREDPIASMALFHANRDSSDVTQIFRGGNEITVSSDGKLLLACATLSSSLALFERDTEQGKLKLIQLVINKSQLSGVSGIAFSPDRKHVYTANEFNDSVSVFELVRPTP